MYQRGDIKNRQDTLSTPGRTINQKQNQSVARCQTGVIVQARLIKDSDIRTVNVQRGFEKAWYLRESVSKTKIGDSPSGQVLVRIVAGRKKWGACQI